MECGAGDGSLTRKIAGLMSEYEFEFHVINDKEISGIDDRIKWINGISYRELEKFNDGSIDLCIIDTDHNYFTLGSELKVLDRKIGEGGMVAMHDLETFYHDTGMAMSYWNDEVYPLNEINECAKSGSLGDALMDFLGATRFRWKMLGYSRHSHGAAVIEKRLQTMFAIMAPGPKSVYAKT